MKTLKKLSIRFLPCILFCLLFMACDKKEISKADSLLEKQVQMEEVIHYPEDENSNILENQENDAKSGNEPIEETVEPDMDRFFLYEDWHPVKQNQFITRIKETLKNTRKNGIDESAYEDDFTTEFSLHDERRNFCLYHNIRNVKDFSIEDYEIYKYWGLMNVWCFLEKEDISVLWSDNTGAILIMGTEDPHYSTKRGIHVGDSAEKILEAYENDCTVEEYNYDEEKWETVSKKEKSGMWLLKSNECISLNAGNMIDEEVMTLSYMLEDGIVYKIVIQCGN